MSELKTQDSWPDSGGFSTVRIEDYKGPGGRIFLGRAATGSASGEVFTIVVPEHAADVLEGLWRAAMGNTLELDQSRVQDVAIISRPMLNFLAETVHGLSEERNRARDAVVRGLKMAEALRKIVDVATGKDLTLNDNQAVNRMGALADDALAEAVE